eukprot:TRINITY_DN1547_c0_g1_i1.p1 TRINITY_DN1547_c0_g1~~TRINITY_DN1547_c0_g1_i1.p1  ORF type:complete len:1101 (+),score=279.45 TRINITY_DN1547_c0_g1_i1:183-3305(+)
MKDFRQRLLYRSFAFITLAITLTFIPLAFNYRFGKTTLERPASVMYSIPIVSLFAYWANWTKYRQYATSGLLTLALTFPIYATTPGYSGSYSSPDALELNYLYSWLVPTQAFVALALVNRDPVRLTGLVFAETIICSLLPVVAQWPVQPSLLMTNFVVVSTGMFAVAVAAFLRFEKHASDKSEQLVARARRRADWNLQFLANMSHELRTPLNGILGGLELLSETPLDIAQKGFVSICEDCTEQMLALVNDFLDMSKLEAGKLKLDAQPFDLARVIESVTEQVYPRAARKSLEMISMVDPACPEIVVGDPNRLTQIVLNLVNNACKFTQMGHVVVRVQLEQLLERHLQENGREEEIMTFDGRMFASLAVLRFEVVDTGIGITEEAAGTLFTRFTQLENAHSRRFDGTGLGLAICKDLVSLMGGEIGVVSAPGKGSTFWFTVPLLSQTPVTMPDSPLNMALQLASTPQRAARGLAELQEFSAPSLHSSPEAHAGDLPAGVVFGDVEMGVMPGEGGAVPRLPRKSSTSALHVSVVEMRAQSVMSPTLAALPERVRAASTDSGVSNPSEGEAENLWDVVSSQMAPRYAAVLRPLPGGLLGVVQAGLTVQVAVCHSSAGVAAVLQRIIESMKNLGVVLRVRAAATLHGAAGCDLLVADGAMLPQSSLATVARTASARRAVVRSTSVASVLSVESVRSSSSGGTAGPTAVAAQLAPRAVILMSSLREGADVQSELRAAVAVTGAAAAWAGAGSRAAAEAAALASQAPEALAGLAGGGTALRRGASTDSLVPVQAVMMAADSVPVVRLTKPVHEFLLLSAVRQQVQRMVEIALSEKDPEWIDLSAPAPRFVPLDAPGTPETPRGAAAAAAAKAVEEAPSVRPQVAVLEATPLTAARRMPPSLARVMEAKLQPHLMRSSTDSDLLPGRPTVPPPSTPGDPRRASVTAEAAPSMPVPARPGEGGASGAAKPLRILSAEDNETNQKLLRALLRSLGAEFLIAGNGAECVTAFKAALNANTPYDLVLMDCQMPVMVRGAGCGRVCVRVLCG